jgi:hypothetical protein
VRRIDIFTQLNTIIPILEKVESVELSVQFVAGQKAVSPMVELLL